MIISYKNTTSTFPIYKEPNQSAQACIILRRMSRCSA